MAACEKLWAKFNEWLDECDKDWTDQGKICLGRTPMQTLAITRRLWKTYIA
jgi:hypothetical protein